MRFFIAFWVFIFHIQIRWPIFDNEVLKSIANQGAIGMTFFFILSGYVLSYSYNSNSTAKSYFKARFARIYPIYFIVAILTLPWLFVNELAPKSSSAPEIVFLILTGVLLMQAWFPPTFGLWNNGGSWSISVEAFFYLCFPALERKLTSCSNKQVLMVLASAYFGILIISASVFLYGNEGMSIAYSIPAFRFLEFVLGICIYKYFRGKDLKTAARFVFFTLLGIFMFDLVILGPKLPMYVTHNWIAVPFFASMLVYISNPNSYLSRILGSRLLNILGKASYSFYSFQVVLILISISFRDSIQSHWSFIGNNQFFAVILFSVLLGSSILVYYFIEEPLRRKINAT